MMIKNKWFGYLIVGLLVISLPTFASLKSDGKRYKKLQKEWIYKGYYKMSKESIKGITRIYNLQAEEGSELTRTDTHTLLAYMWSLGLNEDFAIADSKLALRKAKTPKDKYIAQTSLATAMYNQGWGDLAKDYSNEIEANDEFKGVAGQFQKEQLFSNLMVGSLAIKNGNLKLTHSAFTKIGVETNKPWIPTLAITSAMILNGSILDTPGHIKALINDPTLTSYEREKLVELKEFSMSEIDKTKKDKKMEQLINSLIFDSIKNESSNAIKGIVNELRDYISDID
jgi:hypothetical protein